MRNRREVNRARGASRRGTIAALVVACLSAVLASASAPATWSRISSGPAWIKHGPLRLSEAKEQAAATGAGDAGETVTDAAPLLAAGEPPAASQTPHGLPPHENASSASSAGNPPPADQTSGLGQGSGARAPDQPGQNDPDRRRTASSRRELGELVIAMLFAPILCAGDGSGFCIMGNDTLLLGGDAFLAARGAKGIQAIVAHQGGFIIVCLQGELTIFREAGLDEESGLYAVDVKILDVSRALQGRALKAYHGGTTILRNSPYHHEVEEVVVEPRRVIDRRASEFAIDDYHDGKKIWRGDPTPAPE